VTLYGNMEIEALISRAW